MKVRSEIVAITRGVHNAAEKYNEEKISIPKAILKIQELNKKIVDLVALYEKQEISLKGRIETIQNLIEALSELQDKSKHKLEFQCISSLEKLIASSLQERNFLGQYLDNHRGIKERLEDHRDLTKTLRLRQDTFRLLKNIPSSYLKHMKRIVDTAPSPGYLYLKKDLETFLEANKNILANSQRGQIEELIPLLQRGFEIDTKISDFNLLLEVYIKPREESKPIIDELMKVTLADIVYEIETSIEKLKVGQKFIFPGGIENNRYVLIEVERVEGANNYQLAILNTGADADFGQNAWRNFLLTLGLTNQASTVVFKNLPLEAIADSEFLSELIQFRKQNQVKSLKDSVYKTIVDQLTKKYQGQQSVRELHSVQAWGPTAFDPVLAYVEYSLSESLYPPFQIDMMLRARRDFVETLPESREEGLFPDEILNFIDVNSAQSIEKQKEQFKDFCSHSSFLEEISRFYLQNG